MGQKISCDKKSMLHSGTKDSTDKKVLLKISLLCAGVVGCSPHLSSWRNARFSVICEIEISSQSLYAVSSKEKTDVCDCEYSLGTYIHCVTNIKSGKKRGKRQVKKEKTIV